MRSYFTPPLTLKSQKLGANFLLTNWLVVRAGLVGGAPAGAQLPHVSWDAVDLYGLVRQDTADHSFVIWPIAADVRWSYPDWVPGLVWISYDRTVSLYL